MLVPMTRKPVTDIADGVICHLSLHLFSVLRATNVSDGTLYASVRSTVKTSFCKANPSPRKDAQANRSSSHICSRSLFTPYRYLIAS